MENITDFQSSSSSFRHQLSLIKFTKLMQGLRPLTDPVGPTRVVLPLNSERENKMNEDPELLPARYLHVQA